MKDRITEHMKDIEKRRENSALATHLKEYPNHVVRKDSASLVEKESRNFHRKFKEALYIRKAPNTINRDNGAELNPIGSSLMLPIIKRP